MGGSGRSGSGSCFATLFNNGLVAQQRRRIHRQQQVSLDATRTKNAKSRSARDDDDSSFSLHASKNNDNRVQHQQQHGGSSYNAAAAVTLVPDDHHHYHNYNNGYDAESILKFYDRRPWEVGLRLNLLLLPLLGWYIGLIADQVLGRTKSKDLERRRGEQLRNHLVNSGSVALVKSGQALSLRPDLLRSPVWAEELGKLVDEVGSFPDLDAMNIMREELRDLLPRLKGVKVEAKDGEAGGMNKRATTIQKSGGTETVTNSNAKTKKRNRRSSKILRTVESDPILSLFEFYNDCRVVASASVGQVYKARLRRGPSLEAAIGRDAAKRWGGRTVAIKIQRPDVAASASLDMYLIRRTAMWLSKFRGGDVVAIADTFGMQLFGELDYEREADNCERFRRLYDGGDANGKELWGDVVVPEACVPLTRKRVLVMEWIEGTKGPWSGTDGIDMVRIGLRCSTDQLLRTGLFHADPHRGNLLRTSRGQLAVIDFGMMSDIPEADRYGLIGLVIGLKNKDIKLATENLLKLGFLEDTTQVDELSNRLRLALNNATGGTNKASDLSFSQLQVELDAISRDNVLKFRIPPFITIIIRSLTILEGFALSVDPTFRLIRGAYPYVLKQLISPEGGGETPKALNDLLAKLLLKVDPETSVQEVNWGRLRDFLTLAEKASRSYDPTRDDDKVSVSRKTIDLFLKFFTSKTGLFLKEPLVHELAEMIDATASMGEANLLRISGGVLRPLPGGNGPINERRMEEIRVVANIVQSALAGGEADDDEFVGEGGGAAETQRRRRKDRQELVGELGGELIALLNDPVRREMAAPVLGELSSVFQMVAVEVLEIRSSRAIRGVLGIER